MFQKQWGKNVDFTLSYVKEENEQKKEVENKKIIRLQLNSELDIASKYSLNASKQVIKICLLI